MENFFRSQIAKLVHMNGFVKHVATLATGTVFAGAMGIVVMPLLTRIYEPEDFGVSALYTSLAGIMSVVMCWRYELAVVLPEKDQDAASLLILCIMICFVMGLLTLIMVAIFGTLLSKMLGSQELIPWLWFLPLSLFGMGFFRVLNYWSTRRQHFKRLAVRQIIQNGVTAVTQIGIGLLYSSINAGGLIG